MVADPANPGQMIAASLPASNAHLAWGYFLGDLAYQANGGQDHVNLGFWLAGQPVSNAVLKNLTGTANYQGGMIGTAVGGNNRPIATVVGQFAQQWNFANRTGMMNASYDGANWSSLPLNMPGSNVFSGSGNSSSLSRTLAVQGSFFNNGTVTSPNFPAAVGGLFAIHNATGSYGANGVLVGGVRHP